MWSLNYRANKTISQLSTENENIRGGCGVDSWTSRPRTASDDGDETAPPTGVGARRQEPGSARRRASTRHLRRFPNGRATRAPRCCKGGQQHARHHFTAAPGRSGTRRFNPARAYVPETGRAGAGGRRCSAHRALARAGGAIDRHGDQLSKVPDWETPKIRKCGNPIL